MTVSHTLVVSKVNSSAEEWAKELGNGYDDSDEGEDREPAIPFHIQKKIRDSRNKREWDQKEFASRIKEKLYVVSSYEDGTVLRPSRKVLFKMEKLLGISLIRHVRL